ITASIINNNQLRSHSIKLLHFSVVDLYKLIFIKNILMTQYFDKKHQLFSAPLYITETSSESEVTINDNIIYSNKKEEGKKKTKEKKNVKLSGSTEKLFGSLDFIQQIQDCFKEYVAIMQQKLNP